MAQNLITLNGFSQILGKFSGKRFNEPVFFSISTLNQKFFGISGEIDLNANLTPKIKKNDFRKSQRLQEFVITFSIFPDL